MIKCKICGELKERIYGAHLKKHGITSKEYKKRFPNSPLSTKKDLKNTSKNSGKHMKKEKYKNLFSNKMKGFKNPNSKEKTTEIERKERSPFSKHFYKRKFKDIKENEIDLILKNLNNKIIQKRLLPSNLEYWIKKGYSKKESYKLIKESQTKFSKEKCIKKWGKEKGIEIWQKRQLKWQKTLYENKKLKFGYSNISQELFNSILKKYKNFNNIFYATKNREYVIRFNNKNYLYDFVDKNQKLIIEFQGDLYHGNPTRFDNNESSHPFKKIKNEEIWDKDIEKWEVAKEKGYKILYIWESEYKRNKKESTIKCLSFLNLI